MIKRLLSLDGLKWNSFNSELRVEVLNVPPSRCGKLLLEHRTAAAR